ncbi:MAG: polymer-forming cytoskeletal protein [Bacteroidales bacterium]|nr:polymer-forming cytoskeletal protein [Bacteroidales bacterium]
MAKYTELENNAINLLGVGTEIVGNIVSNGDIRIDGSLSGNLKTKGKVVIGETGTISGEIQCKNSDVEGNVEGKIVVSELLTLKATSVLNGDIVAKKLAIEPGAKFTGNCSMSIDTQTSNAGPKETEKTSAEPAKSK